MRMYLVCGLRIASPIPLPGAPPVDGFAGADVTFLPETRPPGAARWTEDVVRPVHVGAPLDDGSPIVIADRPAGDETLRLRFADGMRVHVAPRGETVWCDWRAPMTAADAVTFLLGPVLGIVLRRHGLLALHASAVVIDGGAVAFLGPGGSGKSTLAAAFAAQGHPMLAEDVLAVRGIDGRWMAEPAYGAIRLWDDSAEMVVGDRPLPRLTPTWDKRALDLGVAAFPMASAAAPLRAVHVLADFAVGEAAPRVERLAPPVLLRELVANVYANQFATGEELARDLAPLRAIAAEVPGFELRPGHGREGLAVTVRRVVLGFAGNQIDSV